MEIDEAVLLLIVSYIITSEMKVFNLANHRTLLLLAMLWLPVGRTEAIKPVKNVNVLEGFKTCLPRGHGNIKFPLIVCLRLTNETAFNVFRNKSYHCSVVWFIY